MHPAAVAARRSCVAQVSGMTCSADTTAVEVALRRVGGVTRAAVALVTGHAEVWYNADACGES